jgi:hypothetical protein
MVLSQWARRGMFDLSHIGITTDAQAQLAERFAIGAGELRRRSPKADKANNVPEVPRVFEDIGGGAWADSRPALAMTLALPLDWTRLANQDPGYNAYSAVALLCYEPHDPRWVETAARNAAMLAGLLHQSVALPWLWVPKFRHVKAVDVHIIKMRPTAVRRILNRRPQVAGGAEVA